MQAVFQGLLLCYHGPSTAADHAVGTTSDAAHPVSTTPDANAVAAAALADANAAAAAAATATLFGTAIFNGIDCVRTSSIRDCC